MKKRYSVASSLTLLFLSCSAAPSTTQWIKTGIKAALFPFDIITESRQVRWDGWSPIPTVKNKEEIKNEIIINFKEKFPGTEKNKSVKYVEDKLKTVLEDRTSPTIKQALIYKYGPFCFPGRTAAYYAHTLPWSPAVSLLKYAVIVYTVTELHRVGKEWLVCLQKRVNHKKKQKHRICTKNRLHEPSK